mmetsp:Transcript_365/g.619  ORF Transcript_365/g.619 Transcript_365/m.619 type:complete len:445 (-) Transcript_365:13-1347(-)
MGDISEGLDSTVVYSGFTRCACVISRSFKDSLLCTCQGDKTITLRTDEGIVRRQMQNDGSRGISCMCVDSASIWIGFSNGLVHIYDIESYTLVHKYKESCGVLCMTYSALLNSIYTGGHGKEILKWSCQRYGEVTKSGLPCHSSAIRSLAADMNYLYSAGDDSTVKCWDVSHNAFKCFWVSTLGDHRSQQITIDDEHLVCLTHEGVYILLKNNGHLDRFVAAETSKFGLLMKDKKSESMWTSDSSGTITIWDQDFLEVQASISHKKPSLVSAMVPVSEICELLIFAQLRERGSSGSLSSLTRISSSAMPHYSPIGKSISEVCFRMITEKSKLVNIHDVTRWLWESYEKHRHTISQLFEKNESKKILRRFFCKLLDNSKRPAVSLIKAFSFVENGLQRDLAFSCYLKLHRNMQRRSTCASQSGTHCLEDHVRMIPYYRNFKALKH